MSYWLTRNNKKECDYLSKFKDRYHLWSKKPKYIKNYKIYSLHRKFLLDEFCCDLFKKITKVELKPGEIKKIKKITFEFEE